MTKDCLSGEVIKSHTTHSDVAGQIVLDDAECRVAEEVCEASWRKESVMRSVSDCVCERHWLYLTRATVSSFRQDRTGKHLAPSPSPSARLLSHTDKNIRKEEPTEELDESLTCLAEVGCVDSRLGRDVLEGLCGRRGSVRIAGGTRRRQDWDVPL
jgi:hypothetical protein